MDIILSNQSGKPIYEQICEQIKSLIISGKLSEGDATNSTIRITSARKGTAH